jgi:hypothetical protein
MACSDGPGTCERAGGATRERRRGRDRDEDDGASGERRTTRDCTHTRQGRTGIPLADGALSASCSDRGGALENDRRTSSHNRQLHTMCKFNICTFSSLR